MTAVAERVVGTLVPPARPLGRLPLPISRQIYVPTVIAIVNAIAFLLVSPNVNDLAAARARASAVSHGVGLTYWFSWFGGGSTPGNYSVLTPYLSALLSAEVVAALSAVAVTVLAAIALRHTRYAAAASGMATFTAGVNLWSGRVPFLLGAAFAVAAIIAVMQHRRWFAVFFTLASIAASPVSGAFLALGLSGVLLMKSSRYRTISAITIGTVLAGLGFVAIAFGTPGPQGFAWSLCVEALLALVTLLIANPQRHLRIVLMLSIAAAFVLVIVPNGMGSNFGRMIWFCLPVAVLATSGRRAWLALALTVPVAVTGSSATVKDLMQAGQPWAGTAYYEPLGVELDRLSGLNNYRVEVVSQGAHNAYNALLDHAMLARGWETQEDNALNATLRNPKLDATSFKIWLDNNSVGYVAFPRSKVETYPEYLLVAKHTPAYLHQVWESADWRLYRVAPSIPIVAQPQSIMEYSQSKLTIRSTCACTFSVRIRYSKYLRATAVTKGSAPAVLANDGYGFTSMTTPGAGDYVLHGTVVSLFR